MIARSSRPILWDVHEEHLDEAEFLWTQWEEALVAANYVLGEVAFGPEERLLAHLDGLVLGGKPVAEKLLLPALASEPPGRIAAAVWALVQTESGDDHQDAVIDAMVNGKPPARAAIVRALGLSPRADLSRVARLWHTGAPAVRAAVFDLFGPCEPAWTRQQLEPILHAGDPALVPGALRALRQIPDRAFIGRVEDALRAEAPEVRAEAIITGVVLKSKAAWDACRRAAAAPGDGCRLPLGLLATSAHPPDRALVLARTRDPEAKRHAIWALGFAGDLEAADALVEAMADEEVAKIAGEALSAITGVALERGLAPAGETRGPDVQEVSDDDPPPEVRPEDSLAEPDPAAVKIWWQRERARFRPGVRHVLGQPRTPEVIRAALVTATMWRREVMWLELASTTTSPPAVDLRTWAKNQRRSLGSGAPAPVPGRAR